MKTQNPVTFSVIVPVYNEEQTVSKVVSNLLSNPYFFEVICVNDGSTDESLRELEKFGDRIKLISFTKNQGKGQALAKGIERAKGDLVVFIDADLTNLSESHIETLLLPILRREADAVLGYAKRGEMPNLAAHLTGQRVYYKEDLLPVLDQIAGSRFGVEVLLNDIFKGKRVAMVPLQDLIGLTKAEKRSPLLAVIEYIEEMNEILSQLLRMKAPALWSILSPTD
jgi:glycosyltransferase involved in cell wall biosynthesis